VHDHPGIVWDEIVGYLVTMALAPAGWLWIVIGFVLFRLFDIVKPWPIRWLDKHVHGGFGIMLDDLLAGLFAAAVLQGVVFFL
jgi:phosphatidylglycerophosphatase A